MITKNAMVYGMGEAIEEFVMFEIPLLLTILIINIICAVVKNVKIRWTINITLITIIIVIETFWWILVHTLIYNPSLN